MRTAPQRTDQQHLLDRDSNPIGTRPPRPFKDTPREAKRADHIRHRRGTRRPLDRRESVAALRCARGTGCVRRVPGSRCQLCPGRSSSSSKDCRPPAPNSCATSAPRQSQMVKPTASNVRTFAGTSDRQGAVAHEQPYHTPPSWLRVPGRPAIVARGSARDPPDGARLWPAVVRIAWPPPPRGHCSFATAASF